MSAEQDMVDETIIKPGVFLTKGMRISIPHARLKVSKDGQIYTSLHLHTGLRLSPYWLSIGAAHVREACQASNILSAAKQADDNDRLLTALESEFIAGMQAMMAAAIAIDAFYAAVKEHSAIPPELSESWRKNKTARYKQIAEVFRTSFQLPSTPDADQLRKIIKEVFRFRDLAVHPASVTNAPSFHPGLNQTTDWRYAAFCFQNAKEAMRMALNVVTELVSKARRGKASPLRSHCESLHVRLEPIVAAWELEFGLVIPDATKQREGT